MDDTYVKATLDRIIPPESRYEKAKTVEELIQILEKYWKMGSIVVVHICDTEYFVLPAFCGIKFDPFFKKKKSPADQLQLFEEKFSCSPVISIVLLKEMFNYLELSRLEYALSDYIEKVKKLLSSIRSLADIPPDKLPAHSKEAQEIYEEERLNHPLH